MGRLQKVEAAAGQGSAHPCKQLFAGGSLMEIVCAAGYPCWLSFAGHKVPTVPKTMAAV